MSKFQVLHSHNDSKILPVIANYIVYTNITLNIIWYKTIYNMKEVIKLLYTIQPIVIISKEVCRICCVNNLTCSMSAILALSSKMASSNFWILFSVTKWLSSTFLSTLSCNNKKEILCWMKCSWELFKKITFTFILAKPSTHKFPSNWSAYNKGHGRIKRRNGDYFAPLF